MYSYAQVEHIKVAHTSTAHLWEERVCFELEFVDFVLHFVEGCKRIVGSGLKAAEAVCDCLGSLGRCISCLQEL